MRLSALPGSAAAIRATLSAAAVGEQRLAGQLTWVTPEPGALLAATAGGGLTLTPVDHLPVGGAAAGCVVESGGARVVYTGDTRPCDALADAARGADLLIHEVGGLDVHADLLHGVGHSTAAAGRIAAGAGVRALALFHAPAARWVAPGDLLAEARRHAPGVEVLLSEDGMTLGV